MERTLYSAQASSEDAAQDAKYSLDVTYLKEEKMLVADTLSRAYLPEVNSCIFFSGAGRG